MNQGNPEAPAHLSGDARQWWDAVVNEYLFTPSELRLLQAASEAWDRAQQARLQVDAEGAVVLDRLGQSRAHPAVAIERDSRAAFARLLRELNLDGGGDADRPPRISNRYERM